MCVADVVGPDRRELFVINEGKRKAGWRDVCGRLPWAVACAIPETMPWHGCHDVGVSDGRVRSTLDGQGRPGG